MQKKLSITATLFLLSYGYVWAQKETSNWVAGHKWGVTFDNGEVTAISDISIQQQEGSACISNPVTGQLLFYSDGQTVWTRRHQIAVNGRNLNGSSTATQSALIVPAPGIPDSYFLFTINADDGPSGGLHYSVVIADPTDSVAVTKKNIRLLAETTEKLTAIRHANQKDYWIISHRADSNLFSVFLLDEKGISLVKELAIGSKHRSGPTQNSEAMGYLKASPNGKMLAAAVFGTNRPFELFDFDDQDGTISNCRSLGKFSGQYGVSFSPDNSRLYLTGLYAHHGAYQFDLTRTNYPSKELTIEKPGMPAEIKIFLSGALQLGPDGKLYAATMNQLPGDSNRIAVIDEPDLIIGDESIRWKEIRGAKGNIMYGLPNFMQHYYNRELVSEDASGVVVLYPNPSFDTFLKISASTPVNPSNLEVYDSNGRRLKYVDVKSHSAKTLLINTTDWPSGTIYLFRLNTGPTVIVRKSFKI